MRATVAFAAISASLAAAAHADGPDLNHRIDVPAEFRSGLSEPGFGWETSDIARYIEGYERMWKSCVKIAAKDIRAVATCPFVCSGTPAAAAGCAAGAEAVQTKLEAEITRCGGARVQEYLREVLGMPKTG